MNHTTTIIGYDSPEVRTKHHQERETQYIAEMLALMSLTAWAQPIWYYEIEIND